MSDLSLFAGARPTPARPGPGSIPEALVAALELPLGRRSRGVMPGDHAAIGGGAGLELDRIRAYVPGDDVRSIDWNVTARTGEPHVREHVPERQLTTWLLLDASASMHFGTADRRKADVAAGVAVIVGRLAARRSNRLGVVTFGGPRQQFFAPTAGRRAMLNLSGLLRDDAAEEGGGHTSPAAAMRLVARSRTSSSLAVIVSDFRGPRDWRSALAELGGRHSVVAVEVVDPREDELVDVGELTLVDPESGRTFKADTGDRRLREAFRSAATDERAAVKAIFRELAVTHVRLSTAGPWLPDLTRGFGEGAVAMNFLAPQLLLGLLLIPAAIGAYVWTQRRSSRYAVRFTNLDLLANIAPRRPGWRRHFPPALYLAAIGGLLFALARPTMLVQVPRDDATVILAVDVSGSMTAVDVTPTRLAAAKSAATSFLDQLPAGVRVGLVAFSNQPRTLVEPTSDREVVRTAIDGLVAKGGTAMGDALMAMLDVAENVQNEDGSAAPGAVATPTPTPDPSATPDPASSAAPDASPGTTTEGPLVAGILLSDGANSTGSTEPLDAAARAAALGVPIYTIALGTADGQVQVPNDQGDLVTVDVPPDRETLAKIAEVTDGTAFDAPTAADLQAIYDHLQSRIGYVPETQEVTAAFAAAALVCVVAGAGLASLWFGRLP